MIVIEVRPHRGGWQCYEAPGVEPYFIGATAKDDALGYAKNRMRGRVGELRVMNAVGEIEQTLKFEPGRGDGVV